jgi:hypothetical protein
MREEFNSLIKSCSIRPDSYRDVPSAETKSIGLQAVGTPTNQTTRQLAGIRSTEIIGKIRKITVK